VILVLGSSADSVYPKLLSRLRERDQPFVTVDEDQPGRYQVESDDTNGQKVFRIVGDECTGRRPVESIFVRHAVARTLDPAHLRTLGHLQGSLNRMLRRVTCPVLNPPAHAFSNYSKPYQLELLANAGFDIPRTLMTNIPEEARAFWDACDGQVIYKGVSNVTTLAQVLTAESLERLRLLPNSPTLFQEFIRGADYRVHVIGDESFVTRLAGPNVDYRRSLLVTKSQDVVIEPAELPASVIKRCIAITRALGLVASGIDFKQDDLGRLVVLELNPYPQFTFYEGRSGQPITQAVVDYLIQHQTKNTNLYA
jgi:glutathione synthase/RimK-type ligase-like ATP-grasp enzyme